MSKDIGTTGSNQGAEDKHKGDAAGWFLALQLNDATAVAADAFPTFQKKWSCQ